jgi:hypothetical protein
MSTGKNPDGFVSRASEHRLVGRPEGAAVRIGEVM